ncbi:MAG: ribosome small subunit-dependent GTPase A, partial [Clostridiales bacterium]|nr:ribosome small subunit-dependent GTPase A [Clostridiales bacterium]
MNVKSKIVELYLTRCRDSWASPVILLSILDLCDDVEEKIFEVEGVSLGFPIHALSAISDQGMDDLNPYLGKGKTIAFLGSSGVGKSTISNFLLGESVQLTKNTNEQTSKGVHTTTTAQLLVSKDDTLIIDTPGLREIQLWCDEETIDTSFEEITSLMENCRFNNCTHRSEPGCAVREALKTGELPADRYERYQKMLREVRHLNNRKKGVEMKLNKRVKQYEKRNSEKKYVNAYEK